MPSLLYDVMGERSAPPVLLLHGYPLSRAIWMPLLPDLSKRVRAFAVDLPGHGASPSGEGAPTTESYARDVLALADTLALARFGLVGHSAGGYVALALARLAPERLSRLALVATRPGADAPESKDARRKQAEMVEREGVRALARAVVPKLLAPGASETLAEEARRIVEGMSVTGVVRTLEAMRERPDLTAFVPSIRVPTLVVAGGKDVLMPRVDQERMAAAIPGARFEVLAASGHLPMMEEPARLAALLGEFFAEE